MLRVVDGLLPKEQNYKVFMDKRYYLRIVFHLLDMCDFCTVATAHSEELPSARLLSPSGHK